MDKTLERILSLLPHKESGELVRGSIMQLGLSLGMKNGNTITDWIGGRNKSYFDYLYEIAAKYGVSVEWLKGETDDPTPRESGEAAARKLERMMADMSREELAALIVRASELLRDK